MFHHQIHVNSNFLPFCCLRTSNSLSLVCDDGITYNIFRYIFSYFLCIWRKIRSHLEKLSMVWLTFCIVFAIGVLCLFSEKSCILVKQDTKWRIEGMKIEDQLFLKGIWRRYKVKKIHFKFQGIETRKNAWKGKKNYKIRTWGAARSAHAPLIMGYAHGTWSKSACCLFFNMFGSKPLFFFS